MKTALRPQSVRRPCTPASMALRPISAMNAEAAAGRARAEITTPPQVAKSAAPMRFDRVR